MKDNDSSKVKRKNTNIMIDVKKEIIAKYEKGFDNEDSAVIDDVVSLDKNMGLEVNNEDVAELLQDHKDELRTEELEQLQKQLQKALWRKCLQRKRKEGRMFLLL